MCQRIFFVPIFFVILFQTIDAFPPGDLHQQVEDDNAFLFMSPRWDKPKVQKLRKPPKGIIRTGRKSKTRGRTLPARKISPANLPGLIPDGDEKQLRIALQRQIKKCKSTKSSSIWNFHGVYVSKKKWCIKTASAMIQILDETTGWAEFWDRARTTFRWYRVNAHKKKLKGVFFTGYYLPTLQASIVPTKRFWYPLYSTPKNKRYSRKQIDHENVLGGQGYELFYVDDMIDAFFLHIQGSGRVIVHHDDGVEQLYVTYADQNGHRYVPIGKILKREGKEKRYWGNMQGIRQYLEEFPDEIDRILPLNPSYIYFRKDKSGVVGSGEVYLSNGHSLAIDPKYLPMGALSLIHTKRPDENREAEYSDFMRIVVNQDTGGAIKGSARADIFWGVGEYAEVAAGNQSHWGDIYIPVLF